MATYSTTDRGKGAGEQHGNMEGEGKKEGGRGKRSDCMQIAIIKISAHVLILVEPNDCHKHCFDKATERAMPESKALETPESYTPLPISEAVILYAPTPPIA